MRSWITITATVVIFGTALFLTEKSRLSKGSSKQARLANARVISAPTGETVRAAGVIEGRTDEVELRARVVEQIHEIHVNKGEWVQKGQPLLSLDDARFKSERDLAAALLSEAEAKKERLENGARETVIEAARQEYHVTKARLDGAEKAYYRAVRLAAGNAVSQQTLEDAQVEVDSLRATSEASKKRLETLELPPRADDLLAATAAVRAANARLKIAQIHLDRTRVLAPSDGRVLAIEAEVGELTGPESTQPLIIMSDTSRLRTVAEIDEYDALKLQLGQVCEITSDGTSGVLAIGKVSEIEPQMNPKKLFGQWAGERTDTYSRRVWIELEQSAIEIPVGLPVDVYIEIPGGQGTGDRSPSDRSPIASNR